MLTVTIYFHNSTWKVVCIDSESAVVIKDDTLIVIPSTGTKMYFPVVNVEHYEIKNQLGQ